MNKDYMNYVTVADAEAVCKVLDNAAVCNALGRSPIDGYPMSVLELFDAISFGVDEQFAKKTIINVIETSRMEA